MRIHAWLYSAWRRIILGGTLFAVALFGMPLKAQAIGSTELITLTNIERSKNGLSALAYNGRLASSAYAKAQDMLAKGYWAHAAPDGTQPWTFVSRAGYSYVVVGENLARDFSSDAAVMSGWMNSPGHRANILNPEYRDVGIAAVSGTMNGEPISLVVAHYGATKAAPAAAAKPAAKPAAPAASPKAAPANPRPAVVSAAPKLPEVPVINRQPEQKKPLQLLLEVLVSMSKPHYKNKVIV